MPALTLSLLGPPQVHLDGQPVNLHKRKAEALFAYLAVTHTLHSRDALAALLWPEFDQPRARMYLRQILYLLTRTLGSELFIVTHELLGLVQNAGLTTDVERFHALLAAANAHELARQPAPNLTALAQAVACYRDDFMAGFSLADAPGFEEWQSYERESLRRELVAALQTLAEGYRRTGQVAIALDYARRWAALEPLQEPAHRCLMCLYVENNEQAAALHQYDRCAALLAEELDALPAAETTALYARIKSGRPLAAPCEAQGLQARPVQPRLPRQPTPFVGRTAELARIEHCLANPACRLLTITGPGGIGKSRLAIAAAQANAHRFAQGVHFVPLAAVRSAQQIEAAILQALDVPLQADVSPRALLLTVCRNKNLLLLLDNYEQLLPATEAITALLDGACQLKLLVTARERLNLSEEWLLPLGGLDAPAAATALPAHGADLLGHSAVQLFVQSAQRVQPAFALTVANGPAVVQLCHWVDSNPLALELAAGWIKMMPPALIVREVQRSLGFLQTEAVDVPPRHRNMQMVFEHSWRLLSAAERRILRGLAVFVGGFSDAAAHAVTGATLTQLATLIDKSWIAATASGRMVLHELIRQFAAEKLASEHQLATGEPEEQVYWRHCRFFGQLMGAMEPLVKGQDQLAAFQRLRAERNNIWAAWNWAVEHGALALFRDAVFVLWYAADTLGWMQEAIDAYSVAIGSFGAGVGRGAEQLNQSQDGIAADTPGFSKNPGVLPCTFHSGIGLEPPDPASILMLAELLTLQAALYTRSGRLALAQQNCEAALAHLRGAPASPQQQVACARAQIVFGWVLHDLAEDEAAVTNLTAARAILRGQQDAWWSGQVELVLGFVVRSLGRHVEARDHFLAATQIWQELGEQRFRCFALARLAELALDAGDHTSARSYLTTVYQLRHSLGDRVGLSYVLTFLGDTDLAQGDPATAYNRYAEAQQLAVELGNHHVLLDALQGLGMLALAQGDWAGADSTFSQEYELALEGRRPHQMMLALLGRGAAAIGQCHQARARTYLRAALQLSTQAHAESLTLQAIFHFAELALQAQAPHQATELLDFVRHHPASTPLLRERAKQLLGGDGRAGALPLLPATPATLAEVVANLYA